MSVGTSSIFSLPGQHGGKFRQAKQRHGLHNRPCPSMLTKCCSILLLPWPAASAVFRSTYSVDHLYQRPECVIYDQKMKGFGMSAHSCSSVLKKVSGTLCCALAQPTGALTTQPRSAVASAVLQTIIGNILSLGNEGAWTHTQLQLVDRNCAIHTPTGPGTGLAVASAGSKFPEKNFSALTKSGHTCKNLYVFFQYSLFFHK